MKSFNYNRLALLSRQRSRVRVPSSPPYKAEKSALHGTESDNPQSIPQFLLNHRACKPHRIQECALRGLLFIAVVLRVEAGRRFDVGVPQEPLHGPGLDLGSVGKECCQAAPKVMESQALSGRS